MKRIILSAGFCLSLMLVAVNGRPERGVPPALPHHNISIWFDLSNHRLYGTVDAIVSRTVTAMTVSEELMITRLNINGKPADQTVKAGLLPLAPHPDQTRVHLEYEGVFAESDPKADSGIIGKQGAFLMQNWYPAAAAELVTVCLKADVPEGFSAVSEADDITVQGTGGSRMMTFDFPHPVPAIHFVMARYVVATERYGDVEIATYFFPEDQKLSERYLQYAKKYLQMYDTMLGSYPFARFAVVENILPTGYGMPTFTLLGRQVLKLPFIPETSLGHEILHSWFGNSVYVDDQNGNWSEGLTTYLADHHYKELKGEGWQYRRQILDDFESYVHPDNEISIRDFYGSEDRARRAVGYGKTAMMFHMLKNRIGDQSFHAALRSLVEEQRFRLTSWQDLQRIFSTASAQDLTGFFDFWLNSKGAMTVNLEGVVSIPEDLQINLEGRARMRNTHMPVEVPLMIDTEDGPEKRSLSLSAPDQPFSLSFTSKPQKIVVDPDYDLFRRLSPSEQRPLLSRLLGDPSRSLVLTESDQERYGLLIRELERRGFQSIKAAEVDHDTLGRRALLFLGHPTQLNTFFPERLDPGVGFSLEVRKNPFNLEGVIAQALAADSGEVNAVIEKLFHYGHYSKIQFSNGISVKKEVAEGARGISIRVAPPAAGFAPRDLLPVDAIVERVTDKAIVYIGEQHNRYGDHLMELEVIRKLHQRHKTLAIGMEMFEHSYQKVLEAYLAGRMDEENFLRESNYFSDWGFNYLLYRDIIQYAKSRGIALIALNQKFELVDKVAKVGLEGLTDEERALIPKEMDFSDKTYEDRLRRDFEIHEVKLPRGEAPAVFEYFYQAQLVWDETMAKNIADFLNRHSNFHLAVLAGAGHLAFGSGIPKRTYRRVKKDYAIILPNQEGVPESGLADFVIFTNDVQAPEPPKLGILLDSHQKRLVVKSFSPESSAEESGMQKGDVILTVDNQEVQDLNSLKALLVTKDLEETVPVTVQRGDRTVEMEVKLQ